MCGIFGILMHNTAREPDPVRLEATARFLGHRGPDSSGTAVFPGLGLVHTRLSLLDLSEHGNQPFWDATGRYCMVYNGEVYNFADLREGLEHGGARFRTGTDTEVILQGVLLHGVDAFIPRLEGMYAFALWDTKEQKLILVRDRFGIKPLWLYSDRDCLIFASEVKAMRPWLTLQPDPVTVSSFLLGHGGPTRGPSFFAGIEIVPPGTILEVRPGHAPTRRTHWHLADFWDDAEQDRLRGLSPAKVVDHFESLLVGSVRKHLIADAPVGALCSGGLDSSIVMAIAARQHSNLAIFHANVVGPLSEYPAALQLAKHLKLDLKVVEVGDQAYADLMPDVLWHYEYPFAYHQNSVPFLSVARLVRECKVKAVLSGEGSDECFLGYDMLAWQDFATLWAGLRARCRRLVQKVPVLGRILATDHDELLLGARIHSRFENAVDLAGIRARLDGSRARPLPERELRSLTLLGYHLRSLLHRNDALGMASSVEARFPFLDHPLVRSAVNAAYRHKLRWEPRVTSKVHPFVTDKWVVRKIADRYLPRSLSRRRKIGFPTTAYQRATIAKEFHADSFLAHHFRLDSDSAARLSQECGTAFSLRSLMLDVWARMFFDGERPDRAVERVNRFLRVAKTAH